MIDYFIRGGIVMYPILLCSVFGLAFLLERLYFLRQGRIHPPDFVMKMKKTLNEEKIQEAIAICSNSPLSIARIMDAGILKKDQPREHIKEAIEHAGKKEADKLHRFLPGLATIAAVAPLLGLLGTVTGMIRAFEVIALKGAGSPTDLASGIAEALITTAAGLFVGIPALVAYDYFQKKAKGFILEMESTSMELLDILEEHSEVNKKIKGGVDEFHRQ
jgi:biopolymer transport protein ExbB